MAAAVVTIWLLGIPPAIIWNHDLPAHGPRSYAWWIILLPMAAFLAFGAFCGLWVFYRWALSREPREALEERIARLEREVLP